MGKLLDLLKAYDGNNSYISDTLKKIRGKKVYIFGAGDRAQWLGKFLLENEIEFMGYMVNKRYFTNEMKTNMYGSDKTVFCYEDIVEIEEQIVVILGISSSLLDLSMFNNKNIREVIKINIGNREDYLIDFSILEDHEKELEELYDKLCDEDSRKNLLYCLRGRLTGKDFPIEPCNWSDPEYFFDEFTEWNEEECIVDCGAYIGDTIDEFIRKNKNRVSKYTIYALEPDTANFTNLCEKYNDDERVVCINKAVYSKSGVMSFSNEAGEMSALSEEINGNQVEIDTIDNILEDRKVTFIKMDVEGSELQALIGAERHIKRDRPILAICIYHKIEDFWTIPKYIMSLNKDYEFYIRPHSSIPTELVLFCK